MIGLTLESYLFKLKAFNEKKRKKDERIFNLIYVKVASYIPLQIIEFKPIINMIFGQNCVRLLQFLLG